MIKVYDEFSQIKNDWDRLYNPMSDVVFQSYDYNEISWRAYGEGKTLYLMTYSESERINAIFPLWLTKKRELRFINDIETDYCDFIYEPNLNMHKLFREFCEYIDSVNIHGLYLINLRSRSPILTYFSLYKGRAVVYSNNMGTYIECHQSNDIGANFSHLSGSGRKHLTNAIRKNQDLKLIIYSNCHNDLFPEKDIRYLSDLMIAEKLRAKEMFSARFWKFIKDNYNSGLLECAILYSKDSVPLSCGFVFCNEYFSVRWVILYSESRYNLLNNIFYIYQKAQNAAYINDFGRGGYDYKVNNFRPTPFNLFALGYSNRFFLSTLYSLKALFFFIKRTIKTTELSPMSR